MIDAKSFVSSIKIKGLNLLPPVITPKLRIELERYKQQAIKLEKRLRHTKDLKKNLEELLNTQLITERPSTAVTISDCNSHVDELGIISARASIQSKKRLNLCMVDVSEYSSNGIKLIGNVNQCGPANSEASTQAYETDDSLSKTCDMSVLNLGSQSDSSKSSLVEQCPVLDLSKLSENETPTQSPRKPRLIRSSSYTLETPSPILLAHLERCSKTDLKAPGTPSMTKNWASLENNYVPFENSQFSSLDTVYHFDKSGECPVPEKDIDKGKYTSSTIEKEKEPSPTIEVIQTDISVQQITVNANTDQVEPVKTTLDLSDPNSQLMQVLKKIPEDYSKQIIELIEKQKHEHCAKVDSFRDQFCSTPIQDRFTLSGTSSPSRSIYCSVSSVDTVLPTSPVRVTDLESCDDQEIVGKSDNGCQDNVKDNGQVWDGVGSRTYSKSSSAVDIKKEWAASIITAYVRGYLTRRLLKTERVQSLIETIRDALICALQLHTIEHIEESDVELHRRLINQVSAACYAFHDIFFTLSTPEKMSIISSDRKRRIEKARRPKSTSDLRRSTTNSARSSARSVSSMSNSLTKI